MGGKITHCVKSPHTAIVHGAPPKSSNLSSSRQRKFSFDNCDVTSQRVELTHHAHDTTTTMSGDPSGGCDAQSALEQIFVLCETGILSTLQFILHAVPEAEEVLNDTHECCIANISMSLTPLQLAAAGGHEDIVCFLLSLPVVAPNRADPAYGFTALHLSVYLNHFVVVETLCKDQRVDPSLRNFDGKSPLHLAVENGNISAVEAIFRLKPNLDFSCTDFDGNTILHALALHPNKRMLMLLLHHINNAILKESSEQMYCEQLPSSSWQKRLSIVKLKRQFFVTSNDQGRTATDILLNLMSLLQNEDSSAPEKKDERPFTASEQSAGFIGLNHHFRGRHELSKIKRHIMLQEVEECFRVLYQEINSPSSSETLTTLNVSSDDTLASQLNVSALSWSPRNESLFQRNTFEDARESPLSLFID